MNSCGSGRRLGVVQPAGDAIVVLAVGGAEVARWPLVGSSRPDLEVIDELARLALAARHFGGEVGLCQAGPELLSLIRFVGLDDVLVFADGVA